MSSTNGWLRQSHAGSQISAATKVRTQKKSDHKFQISQPSGYSVNGWLRRSHARSQISAATKVRTQKKMITNSKYPTSGYYVNGWLRQSHAGSRISAATKVRTNRKSDYKFQMSRASGVLPIRSSSRLDAKRSQEGQSLELEPTDARRK
jgi:fructose 1,6-bisphosphatase